MAFGTVERREDGCSPADAVAFAFGDPVTAALRETVEAFDLAPGPEGASWEFSDLVI
jgi:hypothetical protein